jgi:hypothetical protein
MNALCACVRAGWALLAALLAQGAGWARTRWARLLQLWKRAIEAVASQELAPHTSQELVCVEAAIAAVLACVRGCAPLFVSAIGPPPGGTDARYHAAGAKRLAELVELIEHAMATVTASRLSQTPHEQGQLRLKVSREVEVT